MRRRGRRGFSDPHGRLCEERKHRRGSHREGRINSRRPSPLGVFRSANGACPKRGRHSGQAARLGFTPFVHFKASRGGLRPASHDPRWTYRTIHRWRTFSTSPYLRWHTFPTKPPEEGPCDARQARRNHATSAAAFRLSRKRRDAATASGPHRATRCAMPFSRTGTGASLRPAARGGDKFFRGFGEAIERQGESGSGEMWLSPFLRHY